MNKTITVSIAAYNVEKFMDEALSSLTCPEILDDIEIIIVNDGSKDSTADIAKRYVEKYPDSFFLIDKNNGGYGSTINASIAEASGKYFRLLDGDDWLDKEEFTKYVKALKEVDTDLVITDFVKRIQTNKEEKTDDKYWFYKKNYKHIIPFIFRKNRKLNFTYFIASKNKHINDIRDITTRLNAFYKNGTQKAPVKKSREKFFEDLLNKMKYFFSFKQETFEEYKYRKLLGRLTLYQQKALLMQQLMDINDKIKNHSLVYKNILKDKQTVINKLEKLKIKIYEA